MWGLLSYFLLFASAPLKIAMHETYCTSCIILCIAFLVLIVYSLLYVCLVLLVRRRYRGVRRGVRLLPWGGSCRFLFFWLDRRALFPATYFLLLPLYLTASLVCRSCHVSYRMSPIASLRPIHISYSCCLVTGSAMRVVGLLSTVVICCHYYRYRHCYLVGLYLLEGSEIHGYGYICSIRSHLTYSC
jgi:hypothetical protein